MSSTELCRKTGVFQKTAWLFRMKVLQAMESSDRHPLEGLVDVKKQNILKEIITKSGKKKTEKKQVIFGIERKSNGVARVYCKMITDYLKKEFQQFVKKKISKDSRIKSCQWCSDQSGDLENSYTFIKPVDQSNKEFGLINRVTKRLQSWLSGMHCKVQHLQFYLNEFCYRHNRHIMKAEIFDDLLGRMMKHEPRPYLMIIA